MSTQLPDPILSPSFPFCCCVECPWSFPSYSPSDLLFPVTAP